MRRLTGGVVSASLLPCRIFVRNFSILSQIHKLDQPEGGAGGFPGLGRVGGGPDKQKSSLDGSSFECVDTRVYNE